MARLDKLSLSPGSAAVRLDPPAAHEFTKWDYLGVHGTTDAEKDRMLEWRDYLGVNGGTGDENYDMPEHSFHEDYLIDDDRITCVEFDQKGNFLGTGDEGGRIKVYRRESPDKPFYKLHTRFDGHQELHDFLESESFFSQGESHGVSSSAHANDSPVPDGELQHYQALEAEESATRRAPAPSSTGIVRLWRGGGGGG